MVPSCPACSEKSSHLGPSLMRSLSKVKVSLRCPHAAHVFQAHGIATAAQV